MTNVAIVPIRNTINHNCFLHHPHLFRPIRVNDQDQQTAPLVAGKQVNVFSLVNAGHDHTLCFEYVKNEDVKIEALVLECTLFGTPTLPEVVDVSDRGLVFTEGDCGRILNVREYVTDIVLSTGDILSFELTASLNMDTGTLSVITDGPVANQIPNASYVLIGYTLSQAKNLETL